MIEIFFEGGYVFKAGAPHTKESSAFGGTFQPFRFLPLLHRRASTSHLDCHLCVCCFQFRLALDMTSRAPACCKPCPVSNSIACPEVRCRFFLVLVVAVLLGTVFVVKTSARILNITTLMSMHAQISSRFHRGDSDIGASFILLCFCAGRSGALCVLPPLVRRPLQTVHMVC